MISGPVSQQVLIQLLEDFSEPNMFNSVIMEIMAPSPKNNNPKMSDSFLINSSSSLCSDRKLHPEYQVDNILTHFLPNQAPS